MSVAFVAAEYTPNNAYERQRFVHEGAIQVAYVTGVNSVSLATTAGGGRKNHNTYGEDSLEELNIGLFGFNE